MWQPIDTAPKDGRAILLLSKAVSWNDPLNGDVDHPPRCAIGYWFAEGTSWVDECGRLDGKAYQLAETGVWCSGHGWFQPNEVSHWHPLPSLPEGLSDEGNTS